MYPRLRDLREDSNLTQTEIAKLLNVDQRTYSNYETGTRGVPAEVFIRLAYFYHTSVDYLHGLTNEFQPYPRCHSDES